MNGYGLFIIVAFIFLTPILLGAILFTLLKIHDKYQALHDSQFHLQEEMKLILKWLKSEKAYAGQGLFQIRADEAVKAFQRLQKAGLVAISDYKQPVKTLKKPVDFNDVSILDYLREEDEAEVKTSQLSLPLKVLKYCRQCGKPLSEWKSPDGESGVHCLHCLIVSTKNS